MYDNKHLCFSEMKKKYLVTHVDLVMVILFQLLFRVRGGAQIWTNAQRNWRRRYSTRKSTSGDKGKPAQAFSSKLFFFVCTTFF